MKVKLNELADIRTGYQLRGRVQPDTDGSHRLIQIRDFDDERRLDTKELVTITPKRIKEGDVVRDGDVLFLSRGQRLWSTALEAPPPESLVSGYFFVLRPKSEWILPAYLAWVLNQASFQAELRPFVRGTRMPLVSLGDFSGLRVAVPDLATQQAIVELDRLAVRERELVAKIQEKRHDLISAVAQRAIAGTIKRHTEENPS